MKVEETHNLPAKQHSNKDVTLDEGFPLERKQLIFANNYVSFIMTFLFASGHWTSHEYVLDFAK